MDIVLQRITENIIPQYTNQNATISLNNSHSPLSKFINGIKPSFNVFVRYIKEIKASAEKQNLALKELNKEFHNRIKQREIQQEEFRTEHQQPSLNINDKSDAIKSVGSSSTAGVLGGGLLGTFTSIMSLLGLASGALNMTSFVSALGRFFVRPVLRIGAFILTKMNPVGWIVSIATAIGYGIYKYFTDDEFKKSVDEGLETIKNFVMDDIFQPLVTKMNSIVSGTIDFLSQLWESVSNFAGKAYNYVSDKIGEAKDAAVGAIKDTSAAVTKFATKWVENAPANAGIASPVFAGSQVASTLSNPYSATSAFYKEPYKNSSYENTTKNNDEVVPSNDTGIATPLQDYGNAFTPIPNIEVVPSNNTGIATPLNDYRNAFTPIPNIEVVPSNNTGIATIATPLNDYRNAFTPIPNIEVVPSNNTGIATIATPLNDYRNAFTPIPNIETADASKLSQVANIKGGVDVEHLAPALKVRLAGMATEFVQKTGRKITINSGYRSTAKQAELYKRDPQHAAKPGKSAHEVGAAVDMNNVDINAAEQLGLLRKYKLFRPLYPPFKLSGILESWHVEPLERKGILSYGDGGIVVNNDGAINPSDGSIVPPTRDDGATIGASSAQVNQKEEDATVTQNIIINAQRNYVENYQLSPVIVSSGNKNKNFISPLAS